MTELQWVLAGMVGFAVWIAFRVWRNSKHDKSGAEGVKGIGGSRHTPGREVEK